LLPRVASRTYKLFESLLSSSTSEVWKDFCSASKAKSKKLLALSF
jgi:hypothetical protein